jgi:hypothetical protein
MAVLLLIFPCLSVSERTPDTPPKVNILQVGMAMTEQAAKFQVGEGSDEFILDQMGGSSSVSSTYRSWYCVEEEDPPRMYIFFSMATAWWPLLFSGESPLGASLLHCQVNVFRVYRSSRSRRE